MRHRQSRSNILFILAGAAYLIACTPDEPAKPSAPPVVEPAELSELEPQVRKHISKFLAKARALPGDADRRAQLGLVLAANQLVPESFKEFSVAVKLDPRQKLAHYYMGLAKRSMGDTVGAQGLFREVMAKFPDFAPARHGLGELLLAEGRTADARAAFQRAVNLAPAEPNGYVGLAHAMITERDFQGADGVLDTALRLQPGHPRARYLRGLAYRGLGRREEATRELRAGQVNEKYSMPDPWSADLRKHNKSSTGVVQFAQRYSAQGRHEEARRVLEEAVAHNPDGVDLLVSLAGIHFELDRPRDALAPALRAYKLDSTRSETAMKLALCYQALGQKEEALKFAQRTVDLAPHSARTHHFHADMLRQVGKLPEALAGLKEAARRDPGNSTLLTETGAVLMQLGRTREGISELETAIELDPDNVLSYLNISSACIHLSQWDEARAYLTAAKKRAPRDSRVDRLMAQLPGQ